MQRDEEIRQKRVAAGQQYTTARAAIGASNIQQSGTAQKYLDNLNYTNMREIAWAQTAARKEQRAIEKGASGAGSAFFAQAAGDAIGLAANLYANRSISQGAFDPGDVGTAATFQTQAGAGLHSYTDTPHGVTT
jgi:hypothetical protein